MAKYKPGDPKPPSSGRKKGSKNKSSLRFRELLEQNNVSFEVELAKAILNKDIELIKALHLILPYLQPRLAPQADQLPPKEHQQSNDDLPSEKILELINNG